MEFDLSRIPEDGDLSENELDMRKLVSWQNKKKKKSGGFQSMGLSHAVFKGIMRKGYKVPTPIQRKCIPVIMDGRDMVGMARTGSGKTAAFLIPMLEKLQVHSASTGARALILSPTRELALQTLKFTKELGRFTGLKAAVIVGGESMEDQFAALHENPDIILATPGRLCHVCIEMSLKLTSIHYVVFDEADRLFEMGFQEQLHEILRRLPENRQTLLFSATLPKLLVDFAKAGLSDPVLIRLDVESKLSEQLKLAFFSVRAEDKLALLLHLLRNVIPTDQLTVIFMATKHYVDYLNLVLEKAGVPRTYLYSSLDPTARKINAAKFSSRKVNLLIVTDIAARGIDIPLLDNVINFDFPSKPKLFVHRVGRVARAGRSGVAYSMISPNEFPYLLDLHLFLGRPLTTPSSLEDDDWNGKYGTVPQLILDSEKEVISTWTQESNDIRSMQTVVENAMKKYLRTKPKPSQESVRRSKKVSDIQSQLLPQPLFASHIRIDRSEQERRNLLLGMRAYKPKSTIFEIGLNRSRSKISNTQPLVMMREKRLQDDSLISKFQSRHKSSDDKEDFLHHAHPATSELKKNEEGLVDGHEEDLEDCHEEDLEETFTDMIISKKPNTFFVPRVKAKRRKKPQSLDKEHFIHYSAPDSHSEQGLGVERTVFEREAKAAVLDFTMDDDEAMQRQKNSYKWDRKRKKFIKGGQEPKGKKIKSESGAWVSASYKGDRYEKWKKHHKVEQTEEDDDDEGMENLGRGRNKGRKTRAFTVLGQGGRGGHLRGRGRGRVRGERGVQGTRRELKTMDEIVKGRKLKKKREVLMSRRKTKKRQQRSR